MNWILYGFKSCGKSYFGKRLGLSHLDTDHLIEQEAKQSIREIVAQEGHQGFYKREKQIVANLNPHNQIISVGGATVLDPENLAHLKSIGILIFLSAPKETIKRRWLSFPPLPTFLDPKDPEESFERIWCTRIVEYEKISPYKIDLAGKSETEILEELWRAINSETSFESRHGVNHTEKPSVL